MTGRRSEGAWKKWRRCRAGEVINQIEGFESENRLVLHTAMRDQFDRQANGAGRREAAEWASEELKKLETFFRET